MSPWIMLWMPLAAGATNYVLRCWGSEGGPWLFVIWVD